MKWLTRLPVHLPVCLGTDAHPGTHPGRHTTPPGTHQRPGYVGSTHATWDVKEDLLHWDRIPWSEPRGGGTLWMLLVAPSSCFAQGLFCRCAREAWCFTYTISYGQSCLGSGRGTTKGCNLCLDCGFCHVHLGSYAHFHLLGSCPIYLILFFASLKIAESKKITLSSAWEST